MPKDPLKREITLQKMRDAKIGYIPWNKGKKCPPLSEERKKQMSIAMMGEKNPFWGKSPSEEHRRKISESNKNPSEETRKKLSIAAKNRERPSEETKKKISIAMMGEKNHFWGKTHSEEYCKWKSEQNKGNTYSKGIKRSESTRQKLRIIAQLRPLPSIETRKKIGDTIRGTKRSDAVKENISRGKIGNKNPSWKDGTSNLPYPIQFNNPTRKAIRNIFKFCICCGKPESENITKHGTSRQLDVHHIYHNKDHIGSHTHPLRLVPLCLECHGKEQFKEQEYINYFNKTLNSGFEWGIWSEEYYNFICTGGLT